ncbi:glycosyltransferase involved in cell wall biosynthesis [Agromyces terreus]|uniref:Glycosyltransferase involved in cell wall biosynthesis n=1 Tax=Agromyces terreus TaxID=424795 RepID=A0A9X2GYF7_9MICO|nr:glycosyltransferase family 4 protein [Agromyces terreus]MCP2369470.1 glycosyltransferase involved in cell wall biosynthesis [Agromyces terreus]
MVVANSMKAATALAFLPRGKAVHILYLRDDLNRDRLSTIRWWFLAQVVARRFDAFLANSTWTASTIPGSLRSRPVRVAYPVSGTHRRRRVMGARPNELAILSLSRIAEWKGTDVLISALRILEARGVTFSATVAGGSLFQSKRFELETHRMASTLRSDVRFAGHVADVEALLGSHNTLVSCSVTPEPFGQVVIQGMSAGLAVVATNLGGPVEIIENGSNGILVEPNDAVSLADALQELSEAIDTRDRLAEEGRKRADSFADERTVPALDEAIRVLHDHVRCGRKC